MDNFPNLLEEVLPLLLSGHFSILVESRSLGVQSYSISFENMWLTHANFSENIRTSWVTNTSVTCKGFKFEKKL